jgi:hypothetical protein
MICYNNELDANKARVKLEYFIKEGKVFELKQKRMTRTLRQNRALHKFFEMIAGELNDLGIEFTHVGLSVDIISTMYTPELVKNFFWRPIQIALFGIDSTIDLNTHQINDIIDVITKFFGEKGIYVEFPNKEALLNTQP